MVNNTLISFSLKDKTIIITGASSGIGRQCAISCSEMGASVILLGRDVNRLKETFSLLNEKRNSFYFSVDLTAYNSVEEMINKRITGKHKIDGVVNSAGISTTLPFKLVTPEKINQFSEVNVTSAVNLTRLITQKKNFSDAGGSIIFISSVMALAGESGKTLYSLTKGALLSASRSMAIELASRKIRVNCISPGVVETPMSNNAVYSQDEESLNKIKNLHPLGLGMPVDVANACVFLLSNASKWITGSNLVVDGGYTAR